MTTTQRDDRLHDMLGRPLVLHTCPRCLGGRIEHFLDHNNREVVRTCTMCRGTGEIIERAKS